MNHADGEVRRVHKDGTGAVTLARGRPFPLDIVVTAGAVFWLEAGLSMGDGTCNGTDGALVRMTR
jgi:hypothetical protein